MSLSPWLRSPFTDLTGCLMNHQWYGACRDMELKMLDCLEAYGLDQGARKCDALIKDFQECAGRQKQKRRTLAMRWERNRQYWTGERSKEERWAAAPTPDSF